jgi:hypothetical protein
MQSHKKTIDTLGGLQATIECDSRVENDASKKCSKEGNVNKGQIKRIVMEHGFRQEADLGQGEEG